MTTRSVAILLSLAGCSPELAFVAGRDGAQDVAADSDVPVAANTGCASGIASVQPGVDAILVPVDTSVVLAYTHPLPDGQQPSLRVDGVTGLTALSADRLQATFTPDAPLAPETTYTVIASECEDLIEHGFTTRGVAVSVDDIASRSWGLSVGSSEWIAPASAPLFAPLLDLPSFVLQIDTSSGLPHLVGRFAADTALGLTPVPCAPLLDFGPLDLSDSPRFTTHDDSMTFRWLGLSMSLSAMHVTGTFAGGGTSIAELSLSGLLDARVLEAVTGVEDLCDQAAEFGDACEPCTDGAVACLPSFIVQHEAAEITPIDLYGDWLADHGLCAP